MKKYSYYFGLGTLDFDSEYDFYDGDDWYKSIINSAEWTYILYSDSKITHEFFEEMVEKCIDNIVNKNSTSFDYPEDLNNYSDEDLKDVIDYDDVIFEMQDLYNIEIYRSVAPMIWCDSLWEDDKNYSKDNPPELWRLEIY